MDGWITIGTKLDSKDLDQELKMLKRDLAKYEKENQILLKQKAKIELDTTESEKQIEDLSAKIEANLSKQGGLELQLGNVEKYSEVYFDIKDQIGQVNEETKQYELEHEKTLNVINEQEKALNEVNQKIENNQLKQAEVKSEIMKTNKELANTSAFDNVSKGLSGIINKVVRWGLMLFGIRSAYSLISRSMSTLSQQDKNMSSQLEYIRWTVANAIAPIVKFIINAVYLILQYVNQITRALFGWDLFKGPKEFSKNMKSASGSAEKIRKSLAGFDEMNILGDNTASAGGGGVTTPEFDTASVIDNVNKVKNKMKELGNSWRKETEAMGKALENPEAFRKAYGNWDWLMMGVTRMGYSINNIIFGFSDTFAGTFKIIKGIFTADSKLIADGAKQLIQGIKELIIGLVNLTYAQWEITTGLVKGLLNGLLNWLQGPFLKKMRELFGPIGSMISYPIISAVANIKTTFENWASGVRKICNGVVKFLKGDVKGGITSAFNGLKDVLLAPFRGMRDAINKIIKGLNKIKLPGVLGGGGINIPTIPKFARGTILNNPGRGVPVGIAGEAGREAVLPLSDSRLLEELGSTIGRYITINLTNETKLDGRTIARKISQLNNSDDFLRNR